MRSLAEWVLALAACAGLIWAGAPLVRRLAPPAPSTSAVVESALPGLPVGVPAGAETVPVIMLLDGTAIRVGMREPSLDHPGIARWVSGRRRVEPGVLGERLVVPYESEGARFWVVLDRTEAGRERQITAIYVR